MGEERLAARFFEREGTSSYYDEFHLQTILKPPYLSERKLPEGRRWVLRVSRQSRSADSGVKDTYNVLRAKTKNKALVASAKLLKVKSVQFADGRKASKGYLITK